MWISKKKFMALEKRVADLEKKIQNQPMVQVDIPKIQKELEKNLKTTGISAFRV